MPRSALLEFVFCRATSLFCKPLFVEGAVRYTSRMQPRACHVCGAVVPAGHRFCGQCGTPQPVQSTAGTDQKRNETLIFEASSVNRTAKIVLLRGSGGDGASYHLNSDEHLCGRSEGTVLFPDDPTVSPRHASFFYRDGRLYLRDLGSANGTFIRLRGTIPVVTGDRFICGEQLFEFGEYPSERRDRWVTDTCFGGTPALWNWKFQVGQILSRGRSGVIRSSTGEAITIGREECVLSFPQDRFMSHYHARLIDDGGEFLLEDTDSKNGTYYRVREEVGLKDGDHLFLGRQLIRIEMN